MTFRSRIFAKFFLGASLALLFLNACESGKVVEEKLIKTSSGVSLESFVPRDAWVVFSAVPSSESQRAQTEKLSKAMFQGKESAFIDFLFEQPLQGVLFDGARDVSKFALENNLPLVLGLYEKESEVEEELEEGFDGEEFLPGLEQNPLKESHFIVVVAHSNRMELEAMLQETENLRVTTGESGTLFEQVAPIMFGKLDDNFLIFADRPVDEVIAEASKSNIIASKGFKKLLPKISTDRAGYVYIDPTAVEFYQQLFALSGFGSGRNVQMAGAIIAREEGFEMETFSQIPDVDRSMKEVFKGGVVQLDKKIPAKNVVFYAESFGFGKLIDFQLKNAINTLIPTMAPEQTQQMNYEKFVQNIETTLGMSYEKELMPALSGNFAITLEDQGTLMPGMSFWFDISKNREAGKKLLKKLDETASTLVTTASLALSQEGAPATMLVRNHLESDRGDLYEVVIDAKLLREDEAAFPIFDHIDEKWKLAYGLLNDDILFFGTSGDFGETVVADDESYKNLQSMFAGYDKTDRNFIKTAPVLEYMERLRVIAEKANSFSAANGELFEQIKKYMSPFEAMYTGTKREGDEVMQRVFLKIR